MSRSAMAAPKTTAPVEEVKTAAPEKKAGGPPVFVRGGAAKKPEQT